jgi:MFS family permease
VAPGAALLTVGRVVTGVAVGFASTVAPLYAAEMAPASLGGRFVSAYQLAITVGIFFAYLADDALTSSGRPTTRSRLEFEFRITLRGDLGFTAWSRAVRYHRTPHERAV